MERKKKSGNKNTDYYQIPPDLMHLDLRTSTVPLASSFF